MNTTTNPYTFPLQIIFLVTGLIGLAFTSILGWILIKKIRKSRHEDTILTLISVVFDFLASFGLVFRSVFTQVPYNIFKYHPGWCAYDNIANSFIFVFSTVSLSILSLERVLLIVFNLKLKIFVWIGLFLIVTLIPFCYSIYNSAMGYQILSQIEVLCTYRMNSDTRIFYIILIIITLGTFIVTCACYVLLIWFSSKQCLKQLELNIDKSKVYIEFRIILVKSMSFMITYVILYSARPYCWIYEWVTGTRRTFAMEYTAIIMYSLTVIINCLTILFMNKDVGKEFFKFIRLSKN
jgi:hypothetical protein